MRHQLAPVGGFDPALDGLDLPLLDGEIFLDRFGGEKRLAAAYAGGRGLKSFFHRPVETNRKGRTVRHFSVLLLPSKALLFICVHSNIIPKIKQMRERTAPAPFDSPRAACRAKLALEVHHNQARRPADIARRSGALIAKRTGARSDAFRRETFALPREEARAMARELFQRFPKAAYQTEIETWRVLPGDRIEFTVRRLPSAD